MALLDLEYVESGITDLENVLLMDRLALSQCGPFIEQSLIKDWILVLIFASLRHPCRELLI